MEKQTQAKGWCPGCADAPVFLYADGLCGACTECTPKEHPVGGQTYVRQRKAKDE